MSNTPDAVKRFKRIGVVGAGNMGSMMAFAFSEIGLDVSIWDVKSENVDSFAKQLRQAKGLKGKTEPMCDVDEFTRSLDGQGERKLFIFSITHGYPADSVLSQIKQDLKKGDIILDGGNEHYRNTERRQKECEEIGVSWIGMGVSGGYQSARHGPTKDPKTGMPCVMDMGPRGAGHYVKMIHNGIEVGMMPAVCEDILDKVVQDDDSSEGTPTWSIMESASRHVSAPTLASGLYFRIASGNRAERLKAAHKISMPTPNPVIGIGERETIMEQLRRAVYCVFLSSFCQGLEIISRASIDEEWNIDLGKCIQIWRAGCIIQSEYIADMFQPLLNEKGNHQLTNTKFLNRVAQELQQNYAAIKYVVITGASFDHYLPAISSTLEYMKYIGGTKLPTQFMEA
ncbi:hypothetical protein NUH16_003401 [Penicillium rubens]|nr:hypothetical protein NUH16_003401 [Penicillium rubens]